MRHTLAAIMPCLLLCGFADEINQTPVPEFHAGETRVYVWPTDVGTVGPFRRGLAGDLTDDRKLDAIVLDGSSIAVLPNHGTEGTFLEVELPANDMAVMRMSSFSGVLLVVNETGLHQVWYDAENDRFDDALVMADEWVGATTLRTIDLDGANSMDIVGIDATSTDILIGYSTRPDAVAFADPIVFTPGGTVLDVALVDWDGDVATDVVALTDQGLIVHDALGAPLATVPPPPGASVLPLIAPLRDSLPGQRVAWFVLDEGARHMLVDGQDVSHPPVDLSSIGVVATNAVDYDQDGYVDLFLSRDDGHWVTMLRGNDTGRFSTFDELRFLVDSPMPPDMSGNVVRPIVADFDNDHDTDLLFCIEDTQRAWLFYGEAVDQAQLRPRMRTSNPKPLIDESDALRFELDPPPAIDQMTVTHLDINVWYQPTWSADLALEPRTVMTLELSPDGGDWPLALEIPLVYDYPGMTDEIHYVEMRLQERVGDDVIATYPPVIHAIAISTDSRRLIRLPPVVVPEFEIDRKGGGPFPRLGTGTTGKSSTPPPPPGSSLGG